MEGENAQRKTLPFVWLVVIETTAVVSMSLAVILTSVNMLRHKRLNQHPLLQKYTMRILFMVPLYSVTSSMSLMVRRHNLTQVVECLRMLFETVVIFSFLQYILVCAGGVKALTCRFAKPGRLLKQTRAAEVLGEASQAAAERPSSCAPNFVRPRPSESRVPGGSGATGSGATPTVVPEDSCSSDDAGATTEFDSSQTEDSELEGEVTTMPFGIRATEPDSSQTESEPEGEVAVTLGLALGNIASSESDGSIVTPTRSRSHLRLLRHLPLLDRCLPPWKSATQMLKWCIRGTFSYIIVGILYVIVRVVLFSIERASGKGPDLPGKGPIMKVAQGFLVASQGCAITALTTLGVNMMEDLKPLHGHYKFLSVKLVIFFTFWQGLALMGLERLGALQPMVDQTLHWRSPKEVSTSLQNWLICIEMLIASLLHFPVWPPTDYLIVLAHLEMRRDRLEYLDTQMNAPRTYAVDLRDIYQTAHSVMHTNSI